MVRGSVFLGMVFVLVMAAGIREQPCLADEAGAEEEAEEFIHITTYYPSPYGSYQQLSSEVIKFKTTDGPPDRVFGREEKGMLYFDETDGLMYYDEDEVEWDKKWKPVGGGPYDDLPDGATAGWIRVQRYEKTQSLRFADAGYYMDKGCPKDSYLFYAQSPGDGHILCSAVAPGHCQSDFLNVHGWPACCAYCDDGFKLVETGFYSIGVGRSSGYHSYWTCIKKDDSEGVHWVGTSRLETALF